MTENATPSKESYQDQIKLYSLEAEDRGSNFSAHTRSCGNVSTALVRKVMFKQLLAMKRTGVNAP